MEDILRELDLSELLEAFKENGTMDISRQAIELKTILKNWERDFHEKNGRKANREDVKEAPHEIQESYKEYNILKQRLSSVQVSCNESETRKIPCADGTWGSHLNQSTGCKSGIAKIAVEPDQDSSVCILRQYSKKLQHSDCSLKLPKMPSYRKTASAIGVSSKISTDIDDIQKKKEINECDVKEDDLQNIHSGSKDNYFPENNISIMRSSQVLKPQKIGIGLGMLQLKPHQKHSWKTEWLDSIDVQDCINITKSSTRNISELNPCKTARKCEKKIGANSKFGVLGRKRVSLSPGPPSTDMYSMCPVIPVGRINNEHPSETMTSSQENPPDTNSYSNANLNADSSKLHPETSNGNYEISDERVGKSILESTNKIKESCEAAISLETPGDKFCIVKNQQAVKKWTHTVKTLSKHTSSNLSMEMKDDCCPGEAHSQYEEDINTAKKSNFKDVQVQENTGKHDTQEGKMRDNKSSLIKHRQSASACGPKQSKLNENFVKLEMKKKRYSHKGLFHLKGEAYKRQMWKQKIQRSNRSCGVAERGGRGAGGWKGRKNMANPSDKCFKCGQTGHWASNCYGPKAEDKVCVKEEDFPTLEETAMAVSGDTNIADEPRTEAVYDFRSPLPSIQPLLQSNPSEKAEASVKASVCRALKQMGYRSFRPGQEQAIMRVLSGLSTLVVLSTGAGKSLIYQLASLVYSQRSPCITLVISPLVSLMDDQVKGLPDCLKGVRLHSSMTKLQRDKVMKEIQAGDVNILLISPEAIVGGSSFGGGCMRVLSQLPSIAFACIDEIHCLSEWSHNFRPSYLMLCKVLSDRLGVKCILGLTATATMETANSVAHHLGIADDPHGIIRGTCLPDNLMLSSSRDRNRERSLVELIKSERFCHLPSIIIYCIRREETERIASLLRTCLPDEELQVSPILGITENEVNVRKPTCKQEEVHQVEGIDRLSPQCSSPGIHQTGIPIERSNHDETNTPIVHGTSQGGTFSEVYQSQYKVIIESVKKEMNNALKKNERKTKRKRKRLDSEADDEYHFLEEESGDKMIKKSTRKKQEMKKSNAKKKPRLSQKEAVNDMATMTNANSVEAYHAGMSSSARRRVQAAFMTGKLRIVVATVAFGMGLDKADVRAVIHFNLPKSFESYVQEIGRAGRDQRTAHCHVFLQPQGRDVWELRRHAYANTVDQYCIKKLIRKLFPYCKCQQVKRLCQSVDPYPEEECSVDNTVSEKQVSSVSDYNSQSKEETNNSYRHEQQIGNRLCKGHLVALPIDSTVQELDLKEEVISTLLCYLELHPKHWLVTLPTTHATCTIQCYGGPAQLLQIAKSCPPVAVGISKNKELGKCYQHANSVEFDVVEVARCMGWDLNIVRKELRQLQWRQVLGKGWVKSGVTVEFSNLAFLLLSPGDLTVDEQDDIVSFLSTKSSSQEQRELDQLHNLHSALQMISHDDYMECSASVNVERSNSLKDSLKKHFATSHITKFTDSLNNHTLHRRHGCQCEETLARAAHVRGDVRQFLCMHHDRSFTGRAVARIFHGISSPCYPAQVWGRDRRFWRAHMDFDFNVLIQIATEEIIKQR